MDSFRIKWKWISGRTPLCTWSITHNYVSSKSHKIGSVSPIAVLWRKSCLGISYLRRLDTASASNGSIRKAWPSFFLSLAFLISSSKALLVSIPAHLNIKKNIQILQNFPEIWIVQDTFIIIIIAYLKGDLHARNHWIFRLCVRLWRISDRLVPEQN